MAIRHLLLLAACSVTATCSHSDVAWLRNKTTQLLLACQNKALDNTTLFAPDASGHYSGGQWTRDFAYALMYAGDLFLDTQREQLGASVAYTFKGQRQDGCMPNKVQADGVAVYSPFTDHAIDNGPFAALLLAAYVRRWPQNSEFFCTHEPAVRRGLDFLILTSDGLVYTSPTTPNVSYGFTDNVAKQGKLLFSSLLFLDAARKMAALSLEFGCGQSTRYTAQALAVKRSVQSLYDAKSGLFLACDQGANSLPDVWGSALAVSLGVATSVQTQAIASVIGSEGVTQLGQVRHLPARLVWGQCFGGACPAPGTYQNGAFWATPLAWVVDCLLAANYTTTASQLVHQAITSFQSTAEEGGVMEAVNCELHYHGAAEYVASAASAWKALRTLRDLV